MKYVNYYIHNYVVILKYVHIDLFFQLPKAIKPIGLPTPLRRAYGICNESSLGEVNESY